jgi:ATP synthase protein I
MGKRWADALKFLGIGWYIAVCILLGTLGGRWLGQRLDSSSTEAIFTVLGVLLGVAVAFLGVYRMVKSMMSDDSQK